MEPLLELSRNEMGMNLAFGKRLATARNWRKKNKNLTNF
jgi:hypothetical protein